MDEKVVDLKTFSIRFAESTVRRVTNTQTTYLDLNLGFAQAETELYRIHFDNKQEFNLELKVVESICVTEKHWLLLEYGDEIVDVHLDGFVENQVAFEEDLNSASMETFLGWRSPEHYLNMPLRKFLEKPYGLLMTAPESFANRVIKLGPTFGVDLFIRNVRKPKGAFKVLLMDDLFVVAKEFRIEPAAT
ncbi:MAG: hypothetical protein PSX80_04205 [bacterium]|nr:hypothetical protein [bacterium]